MFEYYKLKQNKIFKTLVFILAIYICAVSVANIIIALDYEHILHCDEDDCLECAIIHFCQIQKGFMYLSIPPTIITLLALNKQKFINLINQFNKNKTLFEYKTQLNM